MVTLFPPPEPVFQGWSITNSAFSAGIPAAIYAFQNVMVTAAARSLEPLMFNCLNQVNSSIQNQTKTHLPGVLTTFCWAAVENLVDGNFPVHGHISETVQDAGTFVY